MEEGALPLNSDVTDGREQQSIWLGYDHPWGENKNKNGAVKNQFRTLVWINLLGFNSITYPSLRAESACLASDAYSLFDIKAYLDLMSEAERVEIEDEAPFAIPSGIWLSGREG